VPPAGVVVSVVVAPRQAILMPVIAEGLGVTVTTAAVLQPATVYRIVVVPDVMPPTTPVVEPTVPIPGDELLQVPPDEVLANVVVYPAHTSNVPVTAAVAGFTVTVLVAVLEQPNVLVTVAVYVNTVGVDIVVGCTYTVVVEEPV